MYTKPSVNCIIGNFGNYLSQYNEEFDSSFLFFVMRKMEFKYIRKENTLKDVRITHGVDRTLHEFKERFAIQSDFIQVKRSKLHKVFKTTKCPYIIEVSTKKLNYHLAYKINHWDMSHYITILDNSRKNFTVSDCYIPNKKGNLIYEGKASYRNILKAWKNCDRFYYNDVDLELFIKAFKINKQICKELFIENMNLFLTKSIENQRMFAEDLVKYPELFSEEELKKHHSVIGVKIQALGLLASRTYIKEFLEKHLNYFNSEVFDFIEYDINEWNKICFGVLKISKNIKPSSFMNISKLILDITLKEEKTYSDLLNQIINN